MAILDSNIVNITLPEMTKTFHTSIDTISWVANTIMLPLYRVY